MVSYLFLDHLFPNFGYLKVNSQDLALAVSMCADGMVLLMPNQFKFTRYSNLYSNPKLCQHYQQQCFHSTHHVIRNCHRQESFLSITEIKCCELKPFNYVEYHYQVNLLQEFPQDYLVFRNHVWIWICLNHHHLKKCVHFC